MAVSKILPMEQQVIAPCYLAISEMLTELERMTFQKFGIAWIKDNFQAYRVKSKISQLKEALSHAVGQMDRKLNELQQQQGEVLTKKREIEEDRQTKQTLKREKEIKLSHYEEQRSGIDAARRSTESEIYSLNREIRELDQERSRLEREMSDLRNEIRSLENQIFSKSDEIRRNKNAKGWLIAGAVVTGIASIFTFGATAPLALAATAIAINLQSEIEDLERSVSGCNNTKNSKEYQIRSIDNSLGSKRGTVQRKESYVRDKMRELESNKQKISQLQNECCLIQRDIVNIDRELEVLDGESATLRDKIKEMADLDKVGKQLLAQVTKMQDITIVMDNNSRFFLSLKSIIKNLGEFAMAANNLENSLQDAMSPQHSLEYSEIKKRLEDFTKRAAFANKKGIK